MKHAFKIETGQIKFRPQHALRMGALTLEQREIEAKLRAHERAMRHLKRTNYTLWRKLKSEGC